MTVIDVHAHVFPPVSRSEGRILFDEGEPWLRVDNDTNGMMMSGDTEYRPVTAELWEPQARLAALDRLGIDQQVVSSTPLMFGYQAEPARAAEWCELVNQRILDYCGQRPDRLLPLCQVPLQHPELAGEMVSTAMAAGHFGVHIGNHIGSRDLDDGPIREFLTHCAHEGAAVLVHPWDITGDDRIRPYMLPWLVGMSAETHLTMLRLMLSGAVEQLPEQLRICFCHGGGSFAYLLGRADNAWRNRDIVRKDSSQPPSVYVRRFHVDSAVFDPRALRLLVDVVGAQQVMLGTDFPFPLGDQQPGEVVRQCVGLTDAERELIMSGNAVDFFGIPTKPTNDVGYLSAT